MSEDVTKFAIRGHIPEMDGMPKAEAFPIFRKKLGEPDYLGKEDDGTVYDFEYESDKHDFVPVYSWEDKQWGIEKVLVDGYTSEIGAYTNISTSAVEYIEQIMRSLFPSIQKVIISSYVYYNGTDKPISFKEQEVKSLGIWCNGA